jgi:sarcosine oxidase
MASGRYDAIVVGVGGMGSAACRHLARRGKRVLGLEQHDVPHELGSSHGVTRIIRKAYYEHPDYVPLVSRAYELWRELEREAGEELLVENGCVNAAAPDSFVIEGALRSCREHGIPHELLEPAEVARRWPAYRLPAGSVALVEPSGGYLLSERCVVAHVFGALRHGAEIRARERVLDWEEAPGGGVRVRSERGEYEAESLVLTAGAWNDRVARLPRPLVEAERQVLGWFQPLRPELFEPRAFPVFVLLAEEGFYYGFPVVSVPGFKIGLYRHLEEKVDPDGPRRPPDAEDERVLRACVERYFPDGNGPTMALKPCLFELSPDEHFVVDRHPESPHVVVGAGFSGHGFKFCSAVGEVLADLALDGATRHPIGFFSLERFTS